MAKYVDIVWLSSAIHSFCKGSPITEDNIHHLISLAPTLEEHKEEKFIPVVNVDDSPFDNVQKRKTSKCTDCKEYNKEKHYCPKFCDVIRDTTEEMQEFYKGEHEKLERIEQIVKEQVIMPEGAYPKLKQIKQVLEQE